MSPTYDVITVVEAPDLSQMDDLLAAASTLSPASRARSPACRNRLPDRPVAASCPAFVGYRPDCGETAAGVDGQRKWDTSEGRRTRETEGGASS